jgi:hypothetical protein
MIRWVLDFARGYQRAADGMDRARELLFPEDPRFVDPMIAADMASGVLDGVEQNRRLPGAIGYGARYGAPARQLRQFRRLAEERSKPALYEHSGAGIAHTPAEA